MDLGLQDKIALVTGASRGIGNRIALALAAEGAKLTICARNEEGLQNAAAELADKGAEVEALVADATRPEDAERIVAATGERWGSGHSH